MDETPVETPAHTPPQPQEPAQGDTGSDAMVPSYRLREEGQKRAEAERVAQVSAEALTGLQSQLEELQAKHSTLNLRYESDLSMQTAGIVDPEVQGFVRERYAASMRDATEKKAFNEWFTGQQENPSPILQPFLKKPDPVVAETPGELPPPVKKVANPEQGIGQPTSTGRTWTVDMIKQVRAENRGGLGPYQGEILLALTQGRVK